MENLDASPFYSEAFTARAATGLSTANAAKVLKVKSSQMKKWEDNKDIIPAEKLAELRAIDPVRDQKPSSFRFIDLFAGIGGLRRAFEAAGGECVFTSEWNKEALNTYLANYGEGHPVAGDITKVQASEVPDHDVLVGGFPCFPAGTLIETATTFRPIEEIKVGDLVATHQRRLKRVLHVMRKDDAQLIEVKVTGVPSLKTTEEHPFYARKRVKVRDISQRSNYRYEFSAPQWVEAKNLTCDHFTALLMDDVDENFATKKSSEFWYLVGRWLGDGWIINHPRTEKGREHQQVKKVMICTGLDDADDLFVAIKAAGFHATRSDERTVTKFHICSHEFVDFLEEFGRLAAGKQVPRRYFSAPLEVQQAIVDGWVDADGHRLDNGKWYATSINRALSFAMARMARNVSGRVATIKRSAVAPTKFIENRLVNQRTQYHTELATKSAGAFVEDGYAWVKVKWVKETAEKATVHNIEVEDDNSYVAESVVVHNCQPFSLAGVSKKNSLGRAHGFADETQGTLFFDVARLIAEKRPAAFLLENVRNLVSHDKGNTFEVIKRTLQDELGYSISWKVMEAKPWVPQKRPRIVIVGFRDGQIFDFDTIDIPAGEQTLASILHRAGELSGDGDRYTTGGLPHAKYTKSDKLWAYLQAHAAKHAAKGNGFGFGLHGPDDVARTLSARYGKDGAEILIRQDGKNPRQLTPRECARLMGFDMPGSPEMIIPVSDAQAYKQFGNSVVVPMFAAVAQAMVPLLGKNQKPALIAAE